MRTTLAIKKDLLDEVKTLSGAKTNKAAVERALSEFVKKRKTKKLLEMEGKVDLSFNLKELLQRRRQDVPHR